MRLRTLLGPAAALTLLSACTTLAPSPATSEAPATTSETATSALTCTLSDDGSRYTVSGTNTSSTTKSYVGDVTFTTDGSQLSPASMFEYYVAPGEVLATTGPTGAFGEDAPTACSAEDVKITDETPSTVGAADVSPCDAVTDSKTDPGTPSYELTVTNSSTKVAAEYAMRVAIRNSDNQRVGTRLFLVVWKGGDTTPLKPGAASTRSDDVLGVPYADGMTCEVVSVEKRTSDDFFTSKEGVQQGSIDADIAFATGSATLTEDAKVLLQSALEPLRTTTGPVCVSGYADSVGAKDANMTLSSERAKSVASYLTPSGVTAEIQTRGMGESEAKKDNVADPKLRRVDIALQAGS